MRRHQQQQHYHQYHNKFPSYQSIEMCSESKQIPQQQHPNMTTDDDDDDGDRNVNDGTAAAAAAAADLEQQDNNHNHYNHITSQQHEEDDDDEQEEDDDEKHTPHRSTIMSKINNNSSSNNVLRFSGTNLTTTITVITPAPEAVRVVSSDRTRIDPSNNHNNPFIYSVCCTMILDSIKYCYSTILLLFSVIVVMTAIFTKQTVATASSDNGGNNIHPIIAGIAFWFLIVWLAMMEGGQGAIVGLQPIPTKVYETSHPRAHKCTTLAYQNGNMEKFIIGRQFLVVLVVFLLSTLSSTIPGATTIFTDVLQLDVFTTIFLDNGIATILVTIVFGQLIAQINSSDCMLDFINNYFLLFTEYVSLLIEASGLLHTVYLVQMIFTSQSSSSSSKKHGTTTNKNHTDNKSDDHRTVFEESIAVRTECKDSISQKTTIIAQPPSVFQTVFFWLRVLLSITILIFAFIVTFIAIFNHQTKIWDGVPVYVSILLLFVLMILVGMMEGIQIALFAVVHRTDLAQFPMVYKNCSLVFQQPQNLPAFLIGRQIFVTCCTFIVARITAINVDLNNNSSSTSNNTEDGTMTNQNENIFGVNDNIQHFFNTGLLGAIITTIIASLIWRILAASFPIAFLSNPLIYILIQLCLYIEKSGICSSAWILAYIQKKMMNYKVDEVYIGGGGGGNSSSGGGSNAEKNNNNKSKHSPNGKLDDEIDLEENAIEVFLSNCCMTQQDSTLESP